MGDKKIDQSVGITKSYWEQHKWYFNCTLLGILLMDTSLQICKDTARIMHRAVLQHPAEWASPRPAVLSCHAVVCKHNQPERPETAI